MPLIEIAHGSGGDVPDLEVLKKTHSVKGCLLDNLSTAYTLDPLDPECTVKIALEDVRKSLDVPRLGFSITTAEKGDVALHVIIGGTDMAVACTFNYFTVSDSTRRSGRSTVVLSVNILGRLSFIEVVYAVEDSSGKTVTTTDGGLAGTGTELITTDSIEDIFTASCLGHTIL